LADFWISRELIKNTINYTYEILDGIDNKLIEADSERLSKLVELANLSAILGNLLRGGIVKYSKGRFNANRPHTYPDILCPSDSTKDFEIKVALEKNNPKGHLVKPGPHLIARYVLADCDGKYNPGKAFRGDVIWIWELRFGHLKNEHFNISNTDGDSGKTAVINAAGMANLQVIYCDMQRCPLKRLSS